MEIIIRPDARSAVLLAAQIVSDRLRTRPDIVLGLATGRTVAPIYAELVRMHRQEGLDFSRCRCFNLDEYVGLAPDDPRSYRATMQRGLFDLVNVDPARTHVPDGMTTDGRTEGRRYEALIDAAGGIGLQLLGLGENGHIGFNEPKSSVMSRTRMRTLTQRTREQNAPLFGGDRDAVPAQAITMGVGTILDAAELLMVATGSAKADMLARALEGPVDSTISASMIQLHPRCQVVADEAAAASLQYRQYYDWVVRGQGQPLRETG